MSTTIDNRAVSDVRDFLTSIPQAWAPFSKTLDVVLSKLEKDQYLIISAKGSNRFVQFACQGEEGMRVEVTSNHFLKGKERLSRRQISWLLANGWNAPTGDVKEATPDKDPNGSPNYFVDLPAPVAAGAVARMAIEALAFGLEIPNPASLAYEALEADGSTLRFEELGLKRSIVQGGRLMEKVLEVFRQVTGIADLEFDKDGDVLVFYRKRPVYATPIENKLRLCSPLVTDEFETPNLLRKMNALNLELHGPRCVFHGGTVFTSLDILADPFVAEYLEVGIREFSVTAERLALLLRDEFSDEGPVKAAAAPHYIQ